MFYNCPHAQPLAPQLTIPHHLSCMPYLSPLTPPSHTTYPACPTSHFTITHPYLHVLPVTSSSSKPTLRPYLSPHHPTPPTPCPTSHPWPHHPTNLPIIPYLSPLDSTSLTPLSPIQSPFNYSIIIIHNIVLQTRTSVV